MKLGTHNLFTRNLELVTRSFCGSCKLRVTSYKRSPKYQPTIDAAKKKVAKAPNAKNGPKGTACFIVFLPLVISAMPTIDPKMNAEPMRNKISGQPKRSAKGMMSFKSPRRMPRPFVTYIKSPKNAAAKPTAKA